MVVTDSDSSFFDYFWDVPSSKQCVRCVRFGIKLQNRNAYIFMKVYIFNSGVWKQTYNINLSLQEFNMLERFVPEILGIPIVHNGDNLMDDEGLYEDAPPLKKIKQEYND